MPPRNCQTKVYASDGQLYETPYQQNPDLRGREKRETSPHRRAVSAILAGVILAGLTPGNTENYHTHSHNHSHSHTHDHKHVHVHPPKPSKRRKKKKYNSRRTVHSLSRKVYNLRVLFL